ncbi:hypothetical protein HOD05_04950 [Candidatus Woesearchaeota archaeon]|jgi:hypothetical protein|nr:hypothetical protein [Candidatus Woesearchaeota archaeon]MBT4150407.1 hypothetical protein [Candidatus Woesearchaeota archaeon]MBT4246981.1 hypothetical protein [Candidatus Woesearchaeota archaeon]MBT4434538.1 hypothetical protein [Candidatus Woesearchaeota archaeon]MBT7331716.1 hypothetical protein [Candidatus Woesearchaeota archaeon]
MTLTKEEMDVLKVLVEKELDHVSKDADKLMISNSPFLTKIEGDQSDLAFMKSEADYQKFLLGILTKL